MKAIITIGHREYLVPDAKKALAFVEMLQKSQVVDYPATYRGDEIHLSAEPVQAGMRVVSATTKIIPAKAQPKKKEP